MTSASGFPVERGLPLLTVILATWLAYEYIEKSSHEKARRVAQVRIPLGQEMPVAVDSRLRELPPSVGTIVRGGLGSVPQEHPGALGGGQQTE